MKLLLDQNLSPRLADFLKDVYPNSSHVALLGLDRSSDEDLWQYARTHDYVIVTKDADLNDLSLLRGYPPKVVWLRLGNCTTRQVQSTLRVYQDAVTNLSDDPLTGILILP